MAEESEEVQEEREDVEEKEEERERCDDFLSGTGGLGLVRPADLCLGRRESGEGGKKGEWPGERGENGPGLGVSGEEGVTGDETGVPGVGVLD